MNFLDRVQELSKLGALRGPALAVVWGRRRVGKTRLLLEYAKQTSALYTVADQSAERVQRRYFADVVATRVPGFADVEYPDWRALFRALAREAERGVPTGPIVIDELPYLVLSCPELPSILQSWVDHEARRASLILIVAGSSRRMMQGLALDASAPLYGRARELIHVRPLSVGHAARAFGLRRAADAVRAYAFWGGIPWYWELASERGDRLEDAVDALVLDPTGLLHQAPEQLLRAEVPSGSSLRPLLDVIGAGAHRVSEIAGRLGVPATSLSRPLAQLIDLDLVRREQPFGAAERSGKRTLYRIDDPFFRLWFRVIAPHRAMLASASPRARRELLRGHVPALMAGGWEALSRKAVPGLPVKRFGGIGPWGPAARYWHGQGPEWDIVSQSLDGAHLLIGEVRWSEGAFGEQALERIYRDLVHKGLERLPAAHGRKIVHAVFVPSCARNARPGRRPYVVIDADDVVQALG